MSSTQPRKCAECNDPLPEGCHGRRRFHMHCADVVRRRALLSLGKRKVRVVLVKGCGVCGEKFNARNERSRYCPGAACKAEGLRRAVLAQKARREEARRGRVT